ncbi:MAG: hypothetical protein LBP52_09950 [Burkholderiaceae bacterium]|nr:hypothetical protein [Burkholderiaceae bacterium]
MILEEKKRSAKAALVQWFDALVAVGPRVLCNCHKSTRSAGPDHPERAL